MLTPPRVAEHMKTVITEPCVCFRSKASLFVFWAVPTRQSYLQTHEKIRSQVHEVGGTKLIQPLDGITGQAAKPKQNS